MRTLRVANPAERLAIGLVLAFAGILVALPIGNLVVEVLREGPGTVERIAGSPGLADAVRNTLVLAAAVTVVSVPLGVALALVLELPHVPARPLWRVAVLLPVLVPDFVLAYSWTAAFGRAGLTDQLIGMYWPSLLGTPGVVAVIAVNAVPLSYLLAAVGLATRSELDLVRAARVSGAIAFTALRTITLPLLRPAIAAASVLIFVLTLASFGIPQVLGAPAGFVTVTTRIYANLSRGADPAAFIEAIALALLLVGMALVLVVPADLVLTPRLRVRRTAQPSGAPVSAAPRWPGYAAAFAIGGYLLVAVGLPLVALVAAALTKAVGLEPVPANLGFGHFRAVLTPSTFEAIARSLMLSAVAATLLAGLGALVAVLEGRRRSRWVASLVTLTLVLPGSTLAVALLLTYGRQIGNTLLIILLAYLAKLWALAHRPLSGAIDRLPAEEMRAARVSGASATGAVRTIALRPLAPALLAAWLVCFLTALHEITMSSLLYGPGTATLAVVVLNQQELGRVGPTAALSVLLAVLTLVAALPLWLAIRRLGTPRSGPGDRTMATEVPTHA
jgi:iron(III) transport system permease protein